MKYKVGDRVRILPNAVEDAVDQSYVGFIGTIIEVRQNNYLATFKRMDWVLTDKTCELVE